MTKRISIKNDLILLIVKLFTKITSIAFKMFYCFLYNSKHLNFSLIKKIFFIFIVYILLSYLREKFNIEDPEHLVLYSTIYYRFSKLYAPNSMVMLLNAKKEIQTNNLLYCHSQNSTTSLISKTQMRIGDPSKHDCLWDIFIVNCTTVLNPHTFGLTTNYEHEVNNVEFEYPETKKYPVVMCYPQMVYESRWQQIIFATEMYRNFGADMQIQYINSAMNEIIDLLKVYEKKQWIAIRNFSYFDFNLTTVLSIGYHPMLELNSRNQAVAYTDCLMKYRESAEYVIIADVDDVFIPQKGTYYDEFSYWNKVYPNVAAFFYYRKSAKLDAAYNFNEFSIMNSIKSFRISNSTFYGKSIYQTKNSEVAWIHTPGLKNEVAVVIPSEKGHIFHVQINDQALRGENSSTYNLHTILSDKQIKTVEKEYALRFSDFPSFHANSVYANSILKCYTEHENWVTGGKKSEFSKFFQCINPLKCVKQTVENFDCTVIRRDFSSNALSSKIVLHVPNLQYYRWTSKNGCSIFLY